MDLKSMVESFRVHELQALLEFACKNKKGKKQELLDRALELIQHSTPAVQMKIEEIHRCLKSSRSSRRMNVLTSQAETEGIPSNSPGKLVDLQNVLNAVGDNGSSKVLEVDKAAPTFPDFQMRELPFFDEVEVLIPPTRLQNQDSSPKQNSKHFITLSPEQVTKINSGFIANPKFHPSRPRESHRIRRFQVQLRLFEFNVSSEQDDSFPSELEIKVNDLSVNLGLFVESCRRNVKPKRIPKPLDITEHLHLRSNNPSVTNTVSISWEADQAKDYCMCVKLVKEISGKELFDRLQARRTYPADFALGMIKEDLVPDSDTFGELYSDSTCISLNCPLGKTRMKYPCRAVTCKHIQCFDAQLFLQMNELRPKFLCPIQLCNARIKFRDLRIDEFMVDVIKNLDANVEAEVIQVFADGTWKPLMRKKTKMIPAVGEEPEVKRMKIPPPITKDAEQVTFQNYEEDDIQIVKQSNNAPRPQPSSIKALIEKQKSSAKPPPIVIELDD